VLLGVYPSGYLGDQNVINDQLVALDQWAGKHTTIAGLFLDIEDPNPAYNVPTPLNKLWGSGYTAFINLAAGFMGVKRSAADIASGRLDSHIRSIAQAYKSWAAQGGGRMAFIAILQEMNITRGNSYGGDVTNFKRAYQRVQDIFSAQGVPSSSVRWVFAPNGADEPGLPTFEQYYPGHARVDVVGFSSFNWGYCYGWEYDDWDLGPELYEPVVQRLNALAPGKPIFITQTGSTAQYPRPDRYDTAKKNEWFTLSYPPVTNMRDVRAILYFNIDRQCDWSFFKLGSLQFDGYRSAVASGDFEYVAPKDISKKFPK
jgi:hypothetical protein